jgi:2'-hydroxyisoflavone reductase
MKSILVLGGTKFLGRTLVQTAVVRGYRVELFHKHPSQLFPELVHHLGDRNGELSALKGRVYDWIIDVSGQRPSQVGLSCQQLSQSSRYLFISSVSAYADHATPGLTEDAELESAPDDRLLLENSDPIMYGARKAECERIVHQHWSDRGCVVRPGLICGPYDESDRVSYWPMRCLAPGPIVVPGNPQDPAQWIDVRDLASFVLRLLVDSHSGVFNGVGPVRPFGEFLDCCQTVTQNQSPIVRISCQQIEQSKLSPWKDFPMWLPPEGDHRGFVQFSKTKSVAAGLRYTDLETTLRDIIAWRQTLDVPLKCGLSQEQENAILASNGLMDCCKAGR